MCRHLFNNKVVFIFCMLMLFTMVFTTQAKFAPVYQDMEIDRGPEKSNVVIRVEVAITPDDRARGLMHREFLAEDAGMLFVFEKDQILSFWMKDTRIPLSIAFIAANGRILEIHDMKPESRELVNSSVPARYALEMNQGGFAKNGIVPGNRVRMKEENH